MFRRSRRKIRKHTSHNEQEVLASDTCGCLGCMATCKPDEIAEWRDDSGRSRPRRGRDRTAICPHCGDALIIGDGSGHRISQAFLEAMRMR
jgi:hypothetical protein